MHCCDRAEVLLTRVRFAIYERFCRPTKDAKHSSLCSRNASHVRVPVGGIPKLQNAEGICAVLELNGAKLGHSVWNNCGSNRAERGGVGE